MKIMKRQSDRDNKETTRDGSKSQVPTIKQRWKVQVRK